MELTPEQQSKAKVLFEYEEAKKALAQRRDDIHLWGKTLIAMGEALLNHPATIVLNERKPGDRPVLSGANARQESEVRMVKANGEQKAAGGSSVHHSDLGLQPSSGNDLHHAYAKPAQPHQAEENAPHCDTRYLDADRLVNLVTEFRELSQHVVELEQQKKHMGYFN